MLTHIYQKINTQSKLNANCSLVANISLQQNNLYMRKNAVLPKKLGKKIQKVRKDKGMSQEVVADKVNISRAYMGFIEQGRNVPSVEILERIARILGIPLKDLF